MASCSRHNGADCQEYTWWEDAGHMLWGCYIDLLRIWLKLMKAVRRGLPLTVAKCPSSVSVPFYSLGHSGRHSVCWLFFPLIVFTGSGESYRDVYVRVCAQLYAILENTVQSSFAPAPWKPHIFFGSCLTAFNKRHKQLWYYLPFPKPWNAGLLIAWCYVS